MRPISLILFFAFCQIIGTMCAVPDLPKATDGTRLTDEMSGMTCSMDGTIMCPPSALSSPERQLKHAVPIEPTQAPLLMSAVTSLTDAPIPAPWPWESVFSIVPLSIASSSVLRI